MDRLSSLTASELTLARSVDLVRYLKCLYDTDDLPHLAVERFRQKWPRSPSGELLTKAVVAPGSSLDNAWAGALVPEGLTTAFVALARGASALGQIPGLHRAPFATSIPIQTGGGTYGWVMAGAPKPVTKLALETDRLNILKCSGIQVITDELFRSSSPNAEAVIRNDMVDGLAGFLDQSFLLPGQAAVVNVAPASITSGVTPITSAGPTPANAATDFTTLLATFNAARPGARRLVLVASPANLGVMSVGLNAPTFATAGGFGVDVVPSASAGSNVILFDPTGILLADEGGAEISVARHAALEMVDNPSAPTSTTVLESLWQRNWIALRCERFINWKRVATDAVQFVGDAQYGGITP